MLAVVLAAAGFVGYKYVLPWWNRQPAPSGRELRVHVLDVGQGDSILIIAPEGKTVLVDAGDEKSGKAVVEALKRLGVQEKIDIFIATHTHPDHIGGAAEVFGSFKVQTVLHNDFPPPEVTAAEQAAAAEKGGKQGRAQTRPPAQRGRPLKFPTVEAYNDFKAAVEQAGAEFRKAELDEQIKLRDDVILTVLAPVPPPFTREQVNAARGGNESNANSIVLRLAYGEFSMLLTGDAESQAEDRMVGREAELASTVLKVAHHGSKYATSENFLKRVFRAEAPKAAVISMSEFNRYGHPSQDVLNRLKAAGVTQLYRTDLQGEISITTTGRMKDGKLFEIKAARETKADLWAGREGTKDDSSRAGFIAYGDYDPPRRQRKQ